MKTASLLAAMITFLAGLSGTALADTVVGHTNDGCNAPQIVTIRNSNGAIVAIKPSEFISVDLPGVTHVFDWYCAKDRNSSSNDAPYDRVKIKRAKDGDFEIWFVRKSPPPSPSGVIDPGTAIARVGDTSDGCNAPQVVTIVGLDGAHKIKPSQADLIDLPKATTILNFKCANSPEVARNGDIPFDRVRVSRNAGGNIFFEFQLKVASADPPGECEEVHAFGQILFNDENGHPAPLARAAVKLLDEDTGVHDEVMAVGFTDGDGRFDLRGKGADSGCVGAGCKRPDPYVQFILHEDHRVEIKDPIGNSPQRRTKTRADTCGEVNLGVQFWDKSRALDPILYERGRDAYQTFQDLTHETRVPGNGGLVSIEHPTVFIATTPYTTWDTIHWPPNDKSVAALDHEFGHRLRHAADGDVDHFNYDMLRFVYARTHDPSLLSNEGFAFNEGWAEYHKTLRHGGPPDSGGGVSDERVEGFVASQLFELSQHCGGFPRLWATMKGAGANAFHSWSEYRLEFMLRNPDCKTPAPSDSAPAPKPASKVPGSRLSQLEQNSRLVVRPDIFGGAVEARPAVARFPGVTGLSAASLTIVKKISDTETASRALLSTKVQSAYQAALGKLTLPVESVADGSYDRALGSARADFTQAMHAAVMDHIGRVRNEVAAAKVLAADPRLLSRLDHILKSYDRAVASPATLAIPDMLVPFTTE